MIPPELLTVSQALPWVSGAFAFALLLAAVFLADAGIKRKSVWRIAAAAPVLVPAWFAFVYALNRL